MYCSIKDYIVLVMGPEEPVIELVSSHQQEICGTGVHVQMYIYSESIMHMTCTLQVHYLATAATKQRLEQELAEAAQEDLESTGSGETGEGGSGSNSEEDGEGREAGALPQGVAEMQNSLEMSMWSLDVSIPSGMMESSSVYETEVSPS